jgi:hypothetical protein
MGWKPYLLPRGKADPEEVANEVMDASSLLTMRLPSECATELLNPANRRNSPRGRPPRHAQKATPKCIANVTAFVAGAFTGRLKRTGKSASTK